jgi:hypothetical protein
MIIDFLKKNYLNIIIIIIVLIILFIISLTLFLYSSYHIYNIVKKNINNRQLICKHNNYTDKDKKILEIYGNYKIKKIYIVYTPFSKITHLGLNLLAYLSCGKTIDSVVTQLKDKNKTNDFEQSHTSLIFELKINKKQSKFIYLQKEYNIYIDTDFFVYNKSNIVPIKLKNKTITLKNLLDITEKRIGKDKFFNWHGYAYNCHTFIDDILLTLQLSKYGKNKFHHTQKYHKFILNNLYSNNSLIYFIYNFLMNDTVFKIYKFLINIT